MINVCSERYLREGAKPIVEEIGCVTEEKIAVDPDLRYYRSNNGDYFYTVSYKGTEEEHNYSWYRKNFLVRVYIAANRSKAHSICFIDDAGWRFYDLVPEGMTPKRKYMPLEEHRRVDSLRVPLLTIDPERMREDKERMSNRDEAFEKQKREDIAKLRKEMEERKRLKEIEESKKTETTSE